ncbi:MAG TPA: FecR domain-containing protein, partial [Kofleriaceae bacterium]|nr:FecR domain-containing protein [Kofleriaceae bacterium]
MTHLPDGTNDKLRAALTHDDALDDVKRARMWANLDARLEIPVATHRWRWPVAFAIAASTAAVLGIVMRHGGGGDVRMLVAPAEATLDAPLGPHVRARLVGPAQLDVLGPAGDVTTVRLSAGTLYAQFDGGPGRSLTIVTTAATIEVVGTVFAVEVRDDDTCVSVAHGRIRATTSHGAWFVATGEHRCGRDAAVSPIDPRVKDALARHEA